MIFDIHAHVIGLKPGEYGNYLCPDRRMKFLLRLLVRQVTIRLSGTAGMTLDERARKTVLEWVTGSRLDRVVLLAMDGAYRHTGELDLDRTQLITSNDFVSGFASEHAKTLFGASVHPYRKDAIEELDRVVAKGACLIKWLPSAQNIDPADPLCHQFYERMAHHGIPLLSHTGVEHTLSVFDDALNDPRRLVTALEKGVTVIAAHCGTRMYLHERSYFETWANMAKHYPTFYGDLSAFGLPVHGSPLRRILHDRDLLAKVVYGSDFPTSPMPLWYVFRLGRRRAMALRKNANPFDKALLTMKELGVPEEVFNRAGGILRLSGTGKPAVE